MATFTVVIPLKGVDKTHDNKGELVGIPYLGPSQRFIFNSEEMKNWLEMFVAGATQYNMVYIEKHPEPVQKDWTSEENKHDYETPRGEREPKYNVPCAVCGLNYGHWTHR